MRFLKTEAGYDKALHRLEVIFDSKPQSKKGQEAELLAHLIEEYEDRIHPINTLDPAIASRIRQEELKLK